MAIKRATTSTVINDTYRNAMTIHSSSDAGGHITPEPWVRPPDWLTLPAASISFVGLLAIYDDSSNYIALSAAGNYTVDWGDGTPTEDVVSGVTAEHLYTYTSIPAGTLCSRGYRQAIVTVTPQSGQSFTTIDLQKKHSKGNLQMYDAPWLDIAIDGADITSIVIGLPAVIVRMRSLEQVTILDHGLVSTLYLFMYCSRLQSVPVFDTSSVTNMSYMFAYCHALRSAPMLNSMNVNNMSYMFYDCYSLLTVPLFNTPVVTNMSYMFYDCSLRTVPLLNTAAVTNMSYMFYSCFMLRAVPLFNTASVTTMVGMFAYCYSLSAVPLFNTASVTSMATMFQYCRALRSVPLFNTANVTTFEYMFQYCSGLQSVPLFNTANVTSMTRLFYYCSALNLVPLFSTANVTNMSNMFANCSAIQSIPQMDASAVSSSSNFTSIFLGCTSLARVQMTGMRFSFSVASCKLDGAALNEIYGNLATTTGQTITVTSNHGTNADDPSIATAKGWTVTGS